MQRVLNWVAIASLLAMVASIVLPVVLAHNPILVWTGTYGNVIARDRQANQYMYTVDFVNIGKAVADNVHCAVSFSDASVTASGFQMNPESLESEVTEIHKTSYYELTVAYLNPDQGGTLGVRIEPTQASAPNVPKVSLFGHDVNGTEATFASVTAGKVALWKVILPAFFVLVTAVIVTWRVAASRYSSKKPPTK